MRVLTALLATTVASLAHAHQAEAPVYILDRSKSLSNDDGPSPTVNPRTARLLLAHRLGLSPYHPLESADDDTLNLLNAYGGIQTPLFGQFDRSLPTTRLLFLIEGVDNPDGLFDGTHKPNYTIASPPPSSSNSQLISDFLMQATQLRSNLRSCQVTIPEKVEVPSLGGGINGVDLSGNCNSRIFTPSHPADPSDLRELDTLQESIQSQRSESGSDEFTGILHVLTLENIAQREGLRSASYRKAMAKLRAIINELKEPSLNQESILVLFPPSSMQDRRSNDAYGPYTVPTTNPLQARQAFSEAPLSSDSLSRNARPGPNGKASKQSVQSFQQKATLLCHHSEESCMSVTGNCSGHGSCFAKNMSRNGNEPSECWACRCDKSGTVRDGTNKTTHWGGPACSKKDVSAPFFLLAGFTVALVAALAWGVGLMYSIGEGELPSVIGAGVSGPRAQK